MTKARGHMAGLEFTSVKLIPWPGRLKLYLWQPMITSPVMQQRMEEPGQVGVISSDYFHLSLIPYTG